MEQRRKLREGRVKPQLINFFRVGVKDDAQEQKGELSFVDLPGYGYAKVNLQEKESWRRMIQAYLAGRPQLLGVLLLVDIRHKLVNLLKLD